MITGKLFACMGHCIRNCPVCSDQMSPSDRDFIHISLYRVICVLVTDVWYYKGILH